MTPISRWHVDTRHIGRQVLVFERTDSTNDLAAALANDPANAGVVVLASEQTAGRGQHGRSWQAPPGSSVLLSVLLFPPPELRRPAMLTAWAAVSVCETILQTANLQAKIKWPNDVLIRGRKVCGILIETRSVERPGRLAVVAGIGLNVNQTAENFAGAGLEEATSLAIAAQRPFDCREVTTRLVRQLDDEYGRMLQGDCGTLEACWKWRVGLLGKPVVAECHGASHRGRLRDMTWDALELEQDNGSLLRLQPETVRHVADE
jgi:BirA family biotin operon repressor/biotin-[acetyl-CoA-carboxylase] ligase